MYPGMCLHAASTVRQVVSDAQVSGYNITSYTLVFRDILPPAYKSSFSELQ